MFAGVAASTSHVWLECATFAEREKKAGQSAAMSDTTSNTTAHFDGGPEQQCSARRALCRSVSMARTKRLRRIVASSRARMSSFVGVLGVCSTTHHLSKFGG